VVVNQVVEVTLEIWVGDLHELYLQITIHELVELLPLFVSIPLMPLLFEDQLSPFPHAWFDLNDFLRQLEFLALLVSFQDYSLEANFFLAAMKELFQSHLALYSQLSKFLAEESVD
jgi:hypothetical protein